ncbi:MAG: hypothetical protein JNK89_09780 [Saprospiraceae bacterium]|nr:hypothetical protein [Saprospiraceae bacterium]
MLINKHTVAKKLFAYLQHRITLAELVDWAENSMLEGDFEATEVEVLSQVLGQLGLADVRSFGLTWEDCQNLMHQLGYDLQVGMAKSA